MSDRGEERSFSIGSAVRFTHQGETIRGHLLQRQGRRRFAKVIDSKERTWNVPEQALEDSGEARLTTMMTRHDEARADYRLGDEVTFAGSDRPRRGEIVKLNPKSAKGALRRDILESLLQPAPRGRRGGREEWRGASERRRGNGSAADGRAWAHRLDPRVRRGRKAPRGLRFQRPCDPDQPQPCSGR